MAGQEAFGLPITGLLRNSMPQKVLPPLRSQLFVPGNRVDFIAGANKYEADAIIVDLEDSVPDVERHGARQALANAVSNLSIERPVSVRVNKPFELLIADLDAAVAAEPWSLVMPKVESAAEVNVVDALIAEREIRYGIRPGSIHLQVLVETCVGLANVMEIASSSERVLSMTLGVEDLAKELEVVPGGVDFDLSWAHSRVLMAACAAQVAPLGLLNSLSNLTDLTGLADDVRRSKAFGFVGAFCVHPTQIPVLNAGFAPSRSEVSQALRIVAALDDAVRHGASSAVLDGRMIDFPVAERARKVVRRAELLSLDPPSK